MQTAKLHTAWVISLTLCSVLTGCPNDNPDDRSIAITAPTADAETRTNPSGSTLAIRWTTTGNIPNLRIELLYDPNAAGDPAQARSVSTILATSTPNDGAYEWIIPASEIISRGYFIRLSDATDSGISTVSCEFAIGGILPDAPSQPTPADSATDVAIDSDLDWSDAAYASAYDVYFGTTDPPPLVGNTASSDWPIATLTHSTTYYWKVVAINDAGSTPGPVWSFTTQPAPDAPADPAPPDAAVDTAIDSDLDWADTPLATSYDVHFGTTTPPSLIGNTVTSDWTLSTLDYGKTYYWSVVAINDAGSNPGPVWSFTTQPDIPAEPAGPNPADGALDLPLATDLDWNNAAWAASYDVYFGTTDPPPLVGHTASSAWPLAPLAHGTTYFWKIVSVNTTGSTSGPVWEFTTQPDIPAAPADPSPADGATDVSVAPDLNWSDALWATSYDVYFGTSNPPPLVDTTAYSDWSPSTLSHDTTYYWKVVAINSIGLTAGPVWSFTTNTSLAGGMVHIPAGEFQMGDAFNEGTSAEQPVHAVYVNGFYMDTCETTNQQYADGLNWALDHGLITVSNGVVYQAGSGTDYPYCHTTDSSAFSRVTWNGDTFAVIPGKANHPMGVVSWYGAAAYCNWRSAMDGKSACYDTDNWDCNFDANGYRLPTEAEWERAARAGADGQRFPWSDTDTIQHARANYWSWSSFSYDTSATAGYHPLWGASSPPFTAPVGFFSGALQYQEDWDWPGAPATYQTVYGPNDYGLYDMAGSVWEWCNDWYSNPYYDVSPYENPHGPDSGIYRVMRGGSWDDTAYGCRIANRGLNEPGDPDTDDGFRCVITP